MSCETEYAEEKENPFAFRRDLECLLKECKGTCGWRFLHFHESHKLHQFENLIDATEPCHSKHFAAGARFENDVKRDDCDKVERKPAEKVVSCDQISVFYHFKIIIIDSGVENDYDVDEK